MLERHLRVGVEKLPGGYQMTGHDLGIRLRQRVQLGADLRMEQADVRTVRQARPGGGGPLRADPRSFSCRPCRLASPTSGTGLRIRPVARRPVACSLTGRPTPTRALRASRRCVGSVAVSAGMAVSSLPVRLLAIRHIAAAAAGAATGCPATAPSVTRHYATHL